MPCVRQRDEACGCRLECLRLHAPLSCSLLRRALRCIADLAAGLVDRIVGGRLWRCLSRDYSALVVAAWDVYAAARADEWAARVLSGCYSLSLN